MPKLRKTKVEKEEEYMSRVAKAMFCRLNYYGYDREKTSKLFGINPATCSARKNQRPGSIRLKEIVRAAQVLGLEPYELLIDPESVNFRCGA